MPPGATRSSSPRCWRWPAETEGEVTVPPTPAGAARRTPRPARARGALRPRAWRGRRGGLPPRLGPGARSRGAPRNSAPRRARAQGADSSRQAPAPGRGRLPLPPPADPRRRLRRSPQGDQSRAARALRRLAGRARRTTSSSWTSSSATTWSRRLGTRPSSASPIPKLAERAGERLAAAGRRALWRGDSRAAEPLLERALELTRPLRFDVHLEVDLAEVSASAEPQKGAATRRSGRRAGTGGGRRGRRGARARRGRAVQIDFRCRPRGRRAGGARARPRCRCSSGRRITRGSRSLGRARRASRAARSLRGAGTGVGAGAPPRPSRRQTAGDTSRTVASARSRAAAGGRGAASARCGSLRCPHPGLLLRADLLAMLGRFDEAWALAREASERLRDFRGAGDEALAWPRSPTRGRPRGRRARLAPQCEALESAGCAASLHFRAGARPLAVRARTLRRGGAAGAARPRARRRTGRRDSGAVATGAGARPRPPRRARRSRAARPRGGRDRRADGRLNYQGDALCDLAEVLAAAGRTDEAAEALEQALERYERKKNLAMVAQVRPRLERLMPKLELATRA